MHASGPGPAPGSLQPGSQGELEPGEDVAAVQRSVEAKARALAGRRVDIRGASRGVHEPHQASAGGEVLADLASHLLRGVALREDLDGQVRSQVRNGVPG